MINKCMSIYIKSEGNNVPHQSPFIVETLVYKVANVPHSNMQMIDSARELSP